MGGWHEVQRHLHQAQSAPASAARRIWGRVRRRLRRPEEARLGTVSSMHKGKAGTRPATMRPEGPVRHLQLCAVYPSECWLGLGKRSACDFAPQMSRRCGSNASAGNAAYKNHKTMQIIRRTRHAKRSFVSEKHPTQGLLQNRVKNQTLMPGSLTGATEGSGPRRMVSFYTP